MIIDSALKYNGSLSPSLGVSSSGPGSRKREMNNFFHQQIVYLNYKLKVHLFTDNLQSSTNLAGSHGRRATTILVLRTLSPRITYFTYGQMAVGVGSTKSPRSFAGLQRWTTAKGLVYGR